MLLSSSFLGVYIANLTSKAASISSEFPWWMDFICGQTPWKYLLIVIAAGCHHELQVWSWWWSWSQVVLATNGSPPLSVLFCVCHSLWSPYSQMGWVKVCFRARFERDGNILTQTSPRIFHTPSSLCREGSGISAIVIWNYLHYRQTARVSPLHNVCVQPCPLNSILTHPNSVILS